jgi:hypothetical protein
MESSGSALAAGEYRAAICGRGLQKLHHCCSFQERFLGNEKSTFFFVLVFSALFNMYVRP